MILLNPQTNATTISTATMNVTLRERASHAPINTSAVMVCGGRRSSLSQYTNACEMFTNGQWSPMPNTPLAPFCCSCLVNMNGLVYQFGGYTLTSGYTANVSRFDPLTNLWTMKVLLHFLFSKSF